MKKPCIRNLEAFRKTGCPEKSWNGEEGCPCWIEMPVSRKDNPLKKDTKKDCLDLWLWEFQWAMLGLLEGNQQATESFRNGMVEVNEEGKARPKPDMAVVELIEILKTLALKSAEKKEIEG